ncbi:MAG: hypothetical protein R2834_18650 [Rhodothermales bacterium]
MLYTVRLSALALAGALLFPFHHVCGQSFSFEIDSFVSVNETDRPLVQHVMDVLSDSLEARGGAKTKKAEMVYHVGLSPAPGDGRFAISIQYFYRLPEAVIAQGVQMDAFYLSLAAEKPADMTEEGSAVRRFMSEEFMRSFLKPGEQTLRVVSMEEIPLAVGEAMNRSFRFERAD